MKITVIGLWHLGSVTTACLCKAGYNVIAYDPDKKIIEKLNNGYAPIFEPELENLLKEARNFDKLKYSNELSDIQNAEIVWVTFDTAVDNNDLADVNYVLEQIKSLGPYIQKNALVLISSQIPVGTTQKLRQYFLSDKHLSDKNIGFAYIPENLRLGKAIDVFMTPARIVIGLDDKSYQNKIQEFLKPFCSNLIWMSVASAEMTKHAINSFLALSVTFINELASLCETVGANGYEVEAGLKTEERIGPKAYLHPGDAIAGGTLMRDVNFLIQLGAHTKQNINLISAILESNRAHQQWVRQKLLNLYNNLDGKNITILGLTYKSDTNTLRRSSAIETCEWLYERGCKVTAFDPSIQKLPNEFAHFIQLADSCQNAIATSDAVVITTAWPQFCTLMPNDFSAEKNKIILDPNGCIAKNMKNSKYINYFSVGYSQKCN